MATKCRCLHQCPDGAPEGICYLRPGGICFAHAEAVTHENGTVYAEITRGCFPPDVEGLLQCKGSLADHDIPKNITCCQNEDFCNDYSFPTIDDKIIEGINRQFQLPTFDWKLFMTIALSSLICLLLLCFVTFVYRRYRLKKQSKFEKERYESDESMDKANYSFAGSPCKPLLPVAQLLDTKFGPYPNIITPRIPLPYLPMSNSSASTSDSCGSTAQFKYNYLNSSHGSSQTGSHNGSNCTINHYRNFSSTASHTTSSMNSELTQQTTLSSQKLTSNGSLPPLNETSVSSGSGSGIMRLVQKTLAREITLDSTPIGTGRYGEVYHGKRRGDDVAVKIFYSREEASWKREIEIYTTVIMRHENILGFLGADVTSWNGCTQLWLVTEYHELGSLYNFLQEHPIRAVKDLLRMMRSIICGLEHLHTEMIGTLGKPAIAHRDLKSKNILMKRDLTCSIADFGLAVTKAANNQANLVQLNHQVGTKRYMAPELLLNETNVNENFEFYKCADIYSLALVFWELYNRLEMPGEVSKYSLPFERDVAKDPSFEEMREVVCILKKRPPLEPHLNENEFAPTLNSIRHLIAECWKEKPSARLSALNIKKKLMRCQVD